MAILYGTTGDGTTLPVLVDQFGNLLAKGIDGPPGPPGPPGVGELPPGATDGALLGWQDGELVWVTEPLPPVIVPGFIPVIYTGNGGTQSITTGFSPDLVWCKSRDYQYSNSLYDTLRGPLQRIKTNSTDPATNHPNSLSSFDEDGFTLEGDTSTNQNNTNYVAWCWDAGDTTVTNNEGTVESQVRSNGSFSVVKYTGTLSTGVYPQPTVGHGLSSAPSLVITKATSASSAWVVQDISLPANKFLYLNEPDGLQDSVLAGANNLGKPSATTFEAAWLTGLNINGVEFIAYCWTETPGLSSFGEYSGTGSRQTINTGFRPSLVIIKSTSSTGNWFMFDNARGTAKTLYANLSSMEGETGAVEFLDDGFQLLFGLPGINESNETYIYAAFANPSDAAFAQRQMRRQARQLERQQNETQPR